MNCVIMMGLPGSGKTTYCAKYLGNYQRISADDFRMVGPGYTYQFIPEREPQVHAACKREFCLWACGEGRSLHMVVDNTNLAIEDIAMYIEVATAFNHTVQIMYLWSDDAFERQTHGVPLNAWQAMAECAKLTILHWPKRWPRISVVRT